MLLNWASSMAQTTLKMGARIAASPRENLDWGFEILGKALGLVDCYAERRMASLVDSLELPTSDVTRSHGSVEVGLGQFASPRRP
jgi:hypothetical protein